MTIPFLSYFTRARKEAATAPPPPPPPIDKPSGDRLSKTVMPSATRTVGAHDPFERASRTAAAVAPPPAVMSPPVIPPRAVAFAPAATARKAADLPPAVALAMEPTIERAVSLEFRDVMSAIPAGFLKPADVVDPSRRVLLKAADVEKGMASGRPTVSLASIFQQVPEFFVKTVLPDDSAIVSLPFAQVLEQFSKMQVRRDQERQHAVPQVETPFLQVTLEDNERFGVEMEHVETAVAPPVKVQTATAESFANAEPEAETTFSGPSYASSAPTDHAPPPAPVNAAAPTPVRIPFKLSANGTDAPAIESVPASGGPSVPKSPPSAALVPTELPKPTRIAFKLPVADEIPAPKVEPWLTAENFGVARPKAEPPAPASASGQATIRINLRTTFENLPPLQLTDSVSAVPADVAIELPFALVEPQLACGRIAITAKTFAAAIPASFRGLFNQTAGEEVVLPLQEVLKNLPAASLKMRDDQVEQELGETFATPFSATAEEDAKRFNMASAPVVKTTVEEPKAEPPIEPPAAEANANAARSDTLRTPLQVALDTDEKLDAKTIVAHVNRMNGISASAIMFADGLNLAGNLPKELESDGLCAMAPGLMQRIENHVGGTKLGALRGLTLECAKGAITFFMHDNLCLAALHANGEINPETREKLGRVVHELSRKYSHPV